jgi:hypothetical protein
VASRGDLASIDWTGMLVLNPVAFAFIGPIAAGIGVRTTAARLSRPHRRSNAGDTLRPIVRSLRSLAPSG